MAGPHFHLQTFGELRLVDSGGVVVACPERGLLILAYLCISGQRTVSREKLAMLIWPEREKSVAFKNLRSTLWRMRHLAAGSAPLTSATEIDVTLGEIACDAAGFETLGRSEQAFRTGLSLWRDTFLASADVPPGRYADWVGEQRSVFTQKLRAALIAGGERFADRSMLRTACMHLLELDPADPAVRAMLERLTGVSLVIGDGPPDGARLRQGAFTGEPARAPARDAMTPPVAPAPRVALLPPAAFGSDPMLHAVSMAVVEDITIGLCALRSMSVVAPYTAERIRDASDKAAFLEKHGVTYALDCRMSDQGLFTQLIFLPSDAIVWAERFSISPVGLLQQRQEIAFHVASAVAEQVETGRIKHLDYVTNPEAYYAYLAGLRNLSNVGLPEIRRARRDFKTALRHKPDFAPALSGIARTYAIEWILTARGDQELLTVAERHAKEAIESNEELPGAHREFGVVRLYQGDLDESLAALDLAENLSPHYADVLYSHADTLVHASRPREALDKLGKALSLNPLAPDMYFWSAAGASYFLEEYEDAIGYVQKMNDKSPGDRLLAASWAMLGDQKKARSYKVKALRANPTFDVDKWLAVVPMKEQWQKDLYREGLKKAGF